jgi:hypothetical protein
MVKVGEGLKGDEPNDWITFGSKFMINIKLLEKNNTLLIKYQTYSPLGWLKRRKINNEFKNFLQELLDTNTINYGLLKLCLDEDITLFEQIIEKGKLTKTLKFNREECEPTKEDLKERFNILKGEILAGNDNPEIKVKCKNVINRLFRLQMIDEVMKNELIEGIDEL